MTQLMANLRIIPDGTDVPAFAIGSGDASTQRSPVLFDAPGNQIMGLPFRPRRNRIHRNYSGRGQVIAFADTGLGGSRQIDHPGLGNRTIGRFPWGRVNATDDPNGHGTHVVGCAGLNYVDAQGIHHNGTAPEAGIIIQSLYTSSDSPLGGIPANIADLFQQAYSHGSAISSNSWGLPGGYESDAIRIDEFSFNHPNMTILFAAGNQHQYSRRSGTLVGSITGTALCKNCIIVGASESLRDFSITYGASLPMKFPSEPFFSENISDNYDQVALFSARGTPGGRILPTVVAPGTAIESSRSPDATQRSGDGVSVDPQLSFMSGTSQATPAVAGIVAVLRQILIENGNTNPSAALLKALVINGAHPLGASSPNYDEGFGRVNARNSGRTALRVSNAGWMEHPGVRQGRSHTFDIKIPPNTPDGSSLKVTLVWTDRPGASLVNDLDLTLHYRSTTTRWNGNTNTAEHDRTNNVEQVTLRNLRGGDLVIRVHGHRVNGIQPFAVAWQLYKAQRPHSRT
ncbi:S8 family serine peptidase [Streptomyces noursei]